jgi:DNA processing protein
MVALLRTGRRPWVEYAELVEERGSAAAVLEEELAQPAAPTGQTTLFPEADATEDGAIADTAELLGQACADLDRWDAAGMRLVTVLEPDYPPNLRAVHDRPPMVFVAGRLTPADAHAIAVVGARKATHDGTNKARVIAEHLIDRGFTVVSGLAAGIDTAAHTAALSNGGRTIAVIGTGLNRAYPPENAALQQEIATKAAVVSQFWPDAPPNRRSFPMRNAVMSGISLGTVIVEARETSGAREQARRALAHGRVIQGPSDLLAALGRITSTNALNR